MQAVPEAISAPPPRRGIAIGKSDTKWRSLELGLLGLVAFSLTFLLARAAQSLQSGAPGVSPPNMVWIPSGELSMGTDSDLGWRDEILGALITACMQA